MNPTKNCEPSSVRVLFVDDEELVLRAFTRWLREAPFEIESATSANEALALLSSRPCDIIVSDYRMPGTDGVAFLKEVAELYPDSHRVLLTAYADLHSTVRAVNEAQVAQVLHKPISVDNLLTVLLGLRYKTITSRRRRRLQEQALELAEANVELSRLVEERTGALLDGLLTALEYRDTETQLHSRRVALYTDALARVAGVEGSELLQIRRGALLHDVGKIGIPDAIIRKPGRLTPEEWQIMRTHPELGVRLLGGISFLKDARRIVHEHHERYDGTGYPRQLRGHKIYLGARLFAIADALDAMTSKRPYRGAMPFDLAYEEIRASSGSHFDPECVAVFESIPRAHWSAAVEAGQSRRGELPAQMRKVWDESVFSEGVGSPEKPERWFAEALCQTPEDLTVQADLNSLIPDTLGTGHHNYLRRDTSSGLPGPGEQSGEPTVGPSAPPSQALGSQPHSLDVDVNGR